jgi:hypothetical protein
MHRSYVHILVFGNISQNRIPIHFKETVKIPKHLLPNSSWAPCTACFTLILYKQLHVELIGVWQKEVRILHHVPWTSKLPKSPNPSPLPRAQWLSLPYPTYRNYREHARRPPFCRLRRAKPFLSVRGAVRDSEVQRQQDSNYARVATLRMLIG